MSLSFDSSEQTAVALPEIEAARDRIAGRVRTTPMIVANAVKDPITNADLWLKLECLQVTGSFKPRGATNRLLTLEPAQVRAGIVTASGGNHGLAVAYAGHCAETRTLVFVPKTTPADKVEKIAVWGAEVRIEGAGWDEAQAAALEAAKRDGLTYIHPFADPMVIAGQGTLGLEMMTARPDSEALIVSIGGGGLISGVASAAKAVNPAIRVIGVEPIGAPTLKRSLEAGELVTLPSIETRAGTLAPRRSAEINRAIISRLVDDIVLVSDEEMAAAARWLWFEFGVAAELSGAASIAALMTGRFQAAPGSAVTALICGAGRDGF